MRNIWKRWRHRTAKAATFDVDDWGLLVEAVATLLLVQIALRVVHFPRLLAWARRVSRPADFCPPEHVARTAWFVDAGGRLIGLRCLTQSLALARLLARRGIETDVRIGIRTDGGRLLAHAWVEWTGRTLNDRPANVQRFSAFSRLAGEMPHV